MKTTLIMGFGLMCFIAIYYKVQAHNLEVKLNKPVKNEVIHDSIDYRCPHCGYEVKLITF